MGEILPCVSVCAVALACRAPLPLTKIRPPFFSWYSRVARVVQPLLFGDVDDVVHGLFNDYVTKPFGTRVLRALVRQAPLTDYSRLGPAL